MTAPAPTPPPSATLPGVALASRHALAWLVFANLIGMWMAAALLWPRLGDLAAPFTFGRWVPLHLNAHLYGWCALPLVAVLIQAFFPHRKAERWSRAAVTAWSAALAFACVSWLLGRTSGKLFMDWRGASRLLFPAALALLALSLAASLRAGWTGWRTRERVWRLVLLCSLVPVPAVLFWAASPSLYPTINPHSGGPTGSSLLGSTLVLIAILLFAPKMLGLPLRAPLPAWMRGLPALLALHFTGYVLLEQGDASHHAALQIIELFSLFLWPPLLIARLRRSVWTEGTRRWLVAFAAWGCVLTASACVMFLPGWLERGKFTNAFVAHSHLAMAGMLTSFLMVVLVTLNPGRAARGLGDPRTFTIWQAGCVLHILSLFFAGALEGANPGVLFAESSAVTLLYTLRLAAGLAMLAASITWLRHFLPPAASTPSTESIA